MVNTVTQALNETSSLVLLDDAGQPAGSLLDSLVIVARYRGVHLSRDQLLRDYQLKSADIAISEALRIASASGLRAKSVRLQWNDLFKMGTAVPSIVLLRNGAAMILLRLISWPYFRKHVLRTVLTTAGIVLGVAVFVGMHTANQTVLFAF